MQSKSSDDFPKSARLTETDHHFGLALHAGASMMEIRAMRLEYRCDMKKAAKQHGLQPIPLPVEHDGVETLIHRGIWELVSGGTDESDADILQGIQDLADGVSDDIDTAWESFASFLSAPLPTVAAPTDPRLKPPPSSFLPSGPPSRTATLPPVTRSRVLGLPRRGTGVLVFRSVGCFHLPHHLQHVPVGLRHRSAFPNGLAVPQSTDKRRCRPRTRERPTRGKVAVRHRALRMVNMLIGRSELRQEVAP